LWNTSSVRIQDTGTFLEDHVDGGLQIQEYVDLFFPIPICSKRMYEPTKRTKVDPRERKDRERQLKAKKRLVELDIQAAQAVTCCIWQCCLATSEEAMRKLRSDY
jgi:hypothetical protein